MEILVIKAHSSVGIHSLLMVSLRALTGVIWSNERSVYGVLALRKVNVNDESVMIVRDEVRPCDQMTYLLRAPMLVCPLGLMHHF